MKDKKPAQQKVAAPVATDIIDAPVIPGSRPYIILLIVGVLVLGVAAVLALTHLHHLMPWEEQVLSVVNKVSLPHFVTAQIARPLSDAVWGILGLIGIFLLIPKFRLRAWQYAVAAGSTYVFTTIIEHIVNRGRPAALWHDVVLRASQDGPGFPSGHVGVLTALCLTVWWFVTWPWRVLLVALVAAEAWSRIFLGMHTPLDVIGAVGAACVVVACIHLAPRKLRRWLRLM